MQACECAAKDAGDLWRMTIAMYGAGELQRGSWLWGWAQPSEVLSLEEINLTHVLMTYEK